jgi:hypothetical protein
MSMGRRQEQRQADLWIATTDLPNLNCALCLETKDLRERPSCS